MDGFGVFTITRFCLRLIASFGKSLFLNDNELTLECGDTEVSFVLDSDIEGLVDFGSTLMNGEGLSVTFGLQQDLTASTNSFTVNRTETKKREPTSPISPKPIHWYLFFASPNSCFFSSNEASIMTATWKHSLNSKLMFSIFDVCGLLQEKSKTSAACSAVTATT